MAGSFRSARSTSFASVNGSTCRASPIFARPAGVILPSATISLIWVFIFTPQTGLFASVQSLLGGVPGAGVLASPNTAMIGVAIATVWWTLGFNAIIYLAALGEISPELYEAAELSDVEIRTRLHDFEDRQADLVADLIRGQARLRAA